MILRDPVLPKYLPTSYFFSAAGVVKAVDGISYDVNQGETIAIVGEFSW